MKLLVSFSETTRAFKPPSTKSKKSKSMPSGSPAPRSRSKKRQESMSDDDQDDDDSDETQIRRSPRVNSMKSSVSLVNLKPTSSKKENIREQELSTRKSSRRVNAESSMTLIHVDSMSAKKANSSMTQEKLSSTKSKSTKRTRDQDEDSEALDILFDENVKSSMKSKGSASAAKSSSRASKIGDRSPKPSAAMMKLNLSIDSSPAARQTRTQTPSVGRPTASQAAVASSLLTLSKNPTSSSKSNTDKQPAKRSRLIRRNSSGADSEDELDFESSQRSHASSPQMGRVGRAESPSW